MTPLAPQHIPTFVLAGRSRFILRSLSTSSELAIAVNYAPKRKVYYVAVYNGAKIKRHNSLYVGTYFPNTSSYRHSAKSKVPEHSDAAKAVRWFFESYLFWPDQWNGKAELLHVGYCGRCGRKLKEQHHNGLGDHCTEIITEQIKIVLPS